MNISIVERPEMNIIAWKCGMSGQQVREAWAALQKALSERNTGWINRQIGYVLVPEWQWATGVKELWAGVEVDSFTEDHDGLEQFVLPPRKYARIHVHGDRRQMERAYRELDKWFIQSGEERDDGQGSFSMEANRLEPVNPFLIPADEIQFFDYDIYAPIVAKP